MKHSNQIYNGIVPGLPSHLSRRDAIKWMLAGGGSLAFTVSCRKSGTPQQAGPGVTLMFWILEDDNPERPDVSQRIADEYMAENPTVDIKIERRTNDAYKEALRLAINTPVSPDGFFSWGGIGLGGFYVNAGGAIPLTDYYAKYNWNERFTPKAIAGTYFNGVQYGMPYRARAMGLYYRKDLFASAGITAKPTTYAELLAAAAKFKAVGLTALGMGGKYGWMLARLTDSLLEMTCGPATHDALRALSVDWSTEPGVTAAFEELKRWADEGYLPADFLGVDPFDVRLSVYQGKAAMMYEGDWMINNLRADGMKLDDYDFFVFPAETGRITYFSEMLFISSTSKHPEEVARFYDFWSSPRIQQRHRSFHTIPPSVGIEPLPDTPQLALDWQKAVDGAAGTYGPSDQALPLELFGSYLRVQAGVVSGSLRPAAAGAALQADITSYQARQAAARKV